MSASRQKCLAVLILGFGLGISTGVIIGLVTAQGIIADRVTSLERQLKASQGQSQGQTGSMSRVEGEKGLREPLNAK